MSWTFLRGVLAVAFAGGTAWVLAEHIRVSPTASLSHRAFWTSSSTSSIAGARTGSYVIFERYLPEPRGEVRSLIKKVGCSEGEFLAVREGSYFCGEEYLGRAKDKTLRGTKLDPFIFNGRIPTGKLFLIGEHKDSYDSRYWGFLDREKVDARAWAIF